MDLTQVFAGKKSYLAAAGLLVVAVTHFAAKDYVGGAVALFQALGVFGLRAAIEQKLGVTLPAVTVAPAAPPQTPAA